MPGVETIGAELTEKMLCGAQENALGQPIKRLPDERALAVSSPPMQSGLAEVRNNGTQAKTPTLLLLLSGCATLPTGPRGEVLPARGKLFDKFQTEDATCRR
jgi:hypothetical protein